MANVIHRTERDANGWLLYQLSVNTPDFDTDDWVVNPDLSGVSGVEKYYWKVTGTPPDGAVVEMDAGEKTAVDATRLANAKSIRKAALSTEASTYLDQRYGASVASQLSALYEDAVDDRPNRVGYLRPWITWREKISADVKAKQDAVDAAVTVSAVTAIQLDTTALDADDPEITLEGAISETDPMDLTSFLDANVEVVDPVTNVSGVFWLMQLMMNRREIFNDTDNPLYDADLTPLIGAGGSVTNLNDIHAKLGWHRQEIYRQGWKRPTDMLFYYGYPNSYNSAVNGWYNEKVAQDMARYGIVVLGQGVEDPLHGDYSNTEIIIPRVKALNPYTKIFGYVSVNASLSAFQACVDDWEILGVDGIFLDEAGYDYGDVSTNGRAAFNTKVDYVHAQANANQAFANAWNTDNVLGTAEDGAHPNSTWNPTTAESNLTTSDWILLESLAVNTTAYSGSGGYAPKADWVARICKAISLRATYGVNFGSLGIINDDNADGQDLFDFTFVSSMMGCLDGNGTSSNYYGSSTAQVAHWDRPDTTKIGAAWTLNCAITADVNDADVYHRYAEFAKFSLDFSSGAQSSSITLS